MKTSNFMYATCLLGSLLAASCSKNNDNELNNTDRDFMVKASISNNVEIGAATLAMTKASNPAVRAFAQHMTAEHTTAQTDLVNLGSNVGYAVKDTIDPGHVAVMLQLSTMTGRAFDSAYIHSQVIDHQATSTNFIMEQNSGQHADVKAYANTYRPHIEMHVVRADSIAKAYFPQ